MLFFVDEEKWGYSGSFFDDKLDEKKLGSQLDVGVAEWLDDLNIFVVGAKLVSRPIWKLKKYLVKL